MAACGQVFFGILVEIDVYRPEFHVIAPNVEYFDNKMSINDKMYPATKMRREIFFVFQC